jgi:hypothetical protein
MVLAWLAAVVVGALWLRGRRRRARNDVERLLDGLSARVADDLAAGREGWALRRYERVADEAPRARRLRELQVILWRERALDGAERVSTAVARSVLSALSRRSSPTHGRPPGEGTKPFPR